MEKTKTRNAHKLDDLAIKQKQELYIQQVLPAPHSTSSRFCPHPTFHSGSGTKYHSPGRINRRHLKRYEPKF